MITREEYELLKYYRATGYGWIARDKNKELCVYEIKPMKLTCSWLNRHIHEMFDSVCDDDYLFPYIKWEDEAPTSIADLINKYEEHQLTIWGLNVNKAELVKDIEGVFDNVNIRDYRIGERFKNRTWEIDSKHIRDIFSVIDKYIPNNVKVTIPQFVADWIENMKIMHTLKGLFSSKDMPKKVQDWLYCNNENCEKMALAWMFGYEIEKEKLYTVRLANGDCLCRIPSKGMAWVLTYSDYKNDKNYQLTQSEIESIDPVLMQLAEEVK